MANNFEELYDELKSDYRFNNTFATKKDFEDYLAKSPDADEDMKIQYGVENATSFLKKKEESDSLSNLQLAGNETTPEVGIPQDNQVVTPEGAEAQGINMAGVYNDVMPEVPVYGKSFQSNIAPPVKPPAVNPKDKQMSDMYVQKLGELKGEIDKGSFRALSDFQRLIVDPKYKELKEKGYFNEQIKQINDSFGKNIYTKSKNLFDKPDVQKSLRDSGITITSATGFTPESLKAKPKAPSVVKSVNLPESERDKIFNSYFAFENRPVKTAEEEQIANQKLDAELSKDAKNLITDGVWIQPTANNKQPGGFLFSNEDGVVEVDPIKVSNQVEKYVRSAMSGVPDQLQSTVTRRLTRLVQQEAENRLISEGQEKVFNDKLAKQNKTVTDFTKIPQEFDLEVRKLANYGFSNLQEYQNASIENITKEISDFSTNKKIELENFAKEIETRSKTGGYLSEAELIADSEVYTRMVSDATTEGIELRNNLVAKAEENFRIKKAEIEKTKKAELDKLYAKYDATVKDGKVSFAAIEKLTQMHQDAYKEFMDGRDAQRLSSQSLANRLSNSDFKTGALVEWVGDRIQGATARTFDNAIEALNATVGYENNPLADMLKYVKYVEINNKKSNLTFADAEGFSESTEAALSSILDQVPNLATGISVGVLTANPYIGGMISWAQDTVDQVGQNYKDKFEATGSEIEARQSAITTMEVQSAMLPLYAIQFAPFTGKFLSTARGMSAKAVVQDVIKLGGVEYAPELMTELVQNYTAAKLNNDPKYKNATFAEYAQAEGPTLALEILPSVAVMSGAGIAKSRYESVQREKRINEFKQFIGPRGLDQTIASAIDVLGPRAAQAVPEYLLQSGQIEAGEFQIVAQGVRDIAETYPSAKSVIKDENKSKYYVDLMGQQKELERNLEAIPEGNVLRDFVQGKIESVKNTMKDLVAGKDVDFVVFENKGGFKYVTDKQRAAQIIERNKEAIETGLIKVNTKDTDINATVQEMTKGLAEKKGSKEVTSYNSGTNLNAATVENQDELNNLLSSSSRDQAELDARVQEAKNAQKVLDTIMPGVKIVLHSDESYQDKMKNVKGKKESFGNFAYVQNQDGTYSVEIQVNLDKANETTIAHEVTHAALLKVFGEDVELFTDFKDRLSALVKDSDNKLLNDFVKQYKSIEIGEEYIAQLTALMANENIKVDTTLMQKIAALINQFVSKITFGTVVPFKDIADVVEVSDFFNSLSDSIKSGKLNKKLNKYAVQEQTAGEVSVQPEARVGEEVVQREPQSETQVPTEEGQEEVSTKAQVGEVKDLPVYHGGSLDILGKLGQDGVLFVSQNKKEAQRYAEQSPQGEQPNAVNEFKITGNIATEDEAMKIMQDLDLKPQNAEYNRDELMFMELVDPNMGETSLSASDIKKFKDALKAAGFDGVEFVDNGLQNKEEKNLYIVSPSAIQTATETDAVVKNAEVNVVTPNNEEIETGDVVISGYADPEEVKNKASLGNVYQPVEVSWTVDPESGIVLRVPEERKSMYDVLVKSGGAVVVANSDGTGIGKVVDGQILQGGIGYTFIEQNIAENIGFAASDDAKIPSIWEAVQQAVRTRDAQNPKMAGKPVAVFVMAQEPAATFGNAYAANYFGNVLKALTKDPNYPTSKAKNELIDFINDFRTNDATGKKYNDAFAELISTIRNTDFTKVDAIDKITNILITEKKRGLPSGTAKEVISENNKRFGFDARRAFFEKFFVGTGKANPTLTNSITKESRPNPAADLRNYLKTKGFSHEGFFNKYLDENILNNLQGETPAKKLKDGGFTMTGFYVDSNLSKEDFVSKSKEGAYKHKQFNSKFHAVDPFVLDGKYYVNEMFPEARFVSKEGKDVPVQASAAMSLYPRTRKGQVADIIARAKKINTPAEFEAANEAFGTEDGEVNLSSKSQLNPKEVSTISTDLSTKVSDAKLNDLKKLINNDVKVPTATKTVYKLFKVKKGFPGELFPLFVGADQSVTTGEWIQAKAGALTQTKDGKTMVKSTLGPLAYRPGWHSGDIPIATHIGSKVNKTDKAPSLRSPNQVWAEVEVGDDVDWQTIANERAEIAKNGQPIAKTAHITDQVPLGGSYKYKTNSNMTGSWVISGEMKVNKVLTQAEVDQINKQNNAKDLPRTTPFDYETYGFDSDGSVKNPKQVVSNQVARAYLKAKETGTNPELINAVDAALSTDIKNKSQLNVGDISPEFQSDLMSGLTEAEALRNIVKKGYLLSDIKNQLGLPYVDEAKYKQAHAELAVESIEKLNQAKRDTASDIETFVNSNYMMPLAEQVSELLDQGFSHYEIFRTMYNMDMASSEDLKEVFGTDYRNTIKNAIESEGFSDDYLDELTADTRTIKKKKVADDLYETWQRAGMDFTDAVSMVEAYADAFEEKGLAEAAVAMRKELEGVTTQEELRDSLVTFSALLSNAGFMLQLGRNLFPKKMGSMIARSLERAGIALTEKQKAELERLTTQLNQSKDTLDAAAATFVESFSDQDYDAAKKAEKEVKNSARDLMKFLDNFKPKFWNDRLTSGGSRALLGIQTVGLSVLANVENALFNQNFIVAGTRKAYDAAIGGVKSDTLSLANWVNATAISKDKTLAEMGEMLKYGFESDPNYIEKFYDGLAQVNFFKDTHLAYKMLGSIFGKVDGKKLWQMTDEEYADAFNQIIYKTKNGDLKLADGKTYKLLTSLFWGWTLAPQATEVTGRLMALGGDKAFANSYTTRALIDYFKNTANGDATGGFIEDYIADRDLTLDRNTLKKLISIVDFGLEGDNPFEKEGLKKVFLGDNMFAKGVGSVRKNIRGGIKETYREIQRSDKFDLMTSLKFRALQTADVVAWSVVPFAKVPANVVYVATQKSFPPAALTIYYGSQRAYDKKQDEFNKKYPKAVKKFATEAQKKAYEKDKMELVKLKRQATYDFAQIEVSFGVAAFATTAVLAGAVIASSEPGEEKDKLYPAANLKAGTYNRTLHMEYLKAVLAGKPVDNFAIRRGGAVKPGDQINNFGNMGISGYALGAYSSAYNSYRSEMVESKSKLKATTYGLAGLLFGELLTSGAKQLPMLQGTTRLYQAFTDEKGYKFSNWASGTAASSLSVFSPSLLSVISKGNAELIQGLGQLQPQYEPSMQKGVYGVLPNSVGKIFANTIQKLNRNVSFLAKNEYYEAQIGPLGEEMQYRTTTSEPGTVQAYLETMVNPFASRVYKGGFTLTPKQAEEQKELYRRSMNIHTTLVNLALAYAELTGSEYVYEVDGQKMNLLTLVTDAKKNEFTFSSEDTRKQQSVGQIRQKYSATYSLPLAMYREELKKRGLQKFYAMQEVSNMVDEGVIGKVQAYIRNGDLLLAQEEIENFFTMYSAARSAANLDYDNDYKNRERFLLMEMKRKGVLNEGDYEKLIGIGGK
jgi:hypothetical protein